MTRPTGTVLTELDLWTRAGKDIDVLAGPEQRLAQGSDGATTPPWTFASATADFIAAGVAPGRIVKLSGGTGNPFSPPGISAASSLEGVYFQIVAVVSAHTLTLGRLGLPAGQGAPLPTATNVLYAIPYFDPQIAAASDWINRELGYDPTTDPADAEARRDLGVALVLARRYLQAARYAGGLGARDAMAEKGRAFAAEATDLLRRLKLRAEGLAATAPVCVRPRDWPDPPPLYPLPLGPRDTPRPSILPYAYGEPWYGYFYW